ncbi:hypothetical protein BGZ63DRAFT_414681 [Mariannaea sp. PMI_226]|nr:hypothetical protein BGZ63DRAFT_414681 [Mariannaea sp. PMI_226]
MLGVFVGPDLQDRFLSNAASYNIYRDHWLVRRSAAAAFSQGFYKLEFGEGSEQFASTEVYYSVHVVKILVPTCPSILSKTPMARLGCFQDHSASNIDIPNVSALELLSRFAKPIRWCFIARELGVKKPLTVTNWPLSSLWSFLSRHCATVLIMAWRLIPAPIRIQAYNNLGLLGLRMYGPSSSMRVQQLPFGREHQGTLANEYGALQLVRRHTRIPVPRPLDLVSDSKRMHINTLADSEKDTLVRDLQTYVGELGNIPRKLASKDFITNALGKECYDSRVLMGLGRHRELAYFVGPFANEAQFNRIISVGLPGAACHHNGHKILFTHGDLNMCNILMQNGRISGIVDWETSGWYPEYWEYTKAHFVSRLQRRWLRIVDEIFEQYGDFEDELETERHFWRYCY